MVKPRLALRETENISGRTEGLSVNEVNTLLHLMQGKNRLITALLYSSERRIHDALTLRINGP